MKIVIDANVFVSGFLFPRSAPKTVLDFVLDECELINSEEMFSELHKTFFKPKFDKYSSYHLKSEFLDLVKHNSSFVNITERISACRDPKDNIILETAVNGNADVIITGDSDLLVLNPFRNIKIITPKEFVDIILKNESSYRK